MRSATLCLLCGRGWAPHQKTEALLHDDSRLRWQGGTLFFCCSCSVYTGGVSLKCWRDLCEGVTVKALFIQQVFFLPLSFTQEDVMSSDSFQTGFFGDLLQVQGQYLEETSL